MKGRGRFWVRGVQGTVAEPSVGGGFVQTLAKEHPTLAGNLVVDYLLLEAGTSLLGGLVNRTGEALYIPLAGELALRQTGCLQRFGPGSLLFLSAGAGFEISTADEPAACFVVAFSTGGENLPDAAPQIFRFEGEVLVAGSPRRQRGETVRLRLANRSSLSIGRFRLEGECGYPIHSHDHDLLLLLLEGRLRGIGHDTPAPAAIYYPAGCPHGASPVPEGMDYLSIEIHRFSE